MTLTYKAAIKSYIIGRRHKRANSSGILQLPDSYAMGSREAVTNYRIVEVLAVPSDLEGKLKVGQVMLVHELDKVPNEIGYIDHLDKDIQSIPWSRVWAVGDSVETLEPLNDNVFVQEDEEKEEYTEGGLIKPRLCTGCERYGTVIKTGPKATVEVGMKVMYLIGFGLFFRNLEVLPFLAINEVDLIGIINSG